MALPQAEAPPWHTAPAPLPRNRSLARFTSQGILAHVLGWLGESLRSSGQPRRRRRLSPSVAKAGPAQAEEIARLRAENAALHRQVEALLALRESERSRTGSAAAV